MLEKFCASLPLIYPLATIHLLKITTLQTYLDDLICAIFDSYVHVMQVKSVFFRHHST